MAELLEGPGKVGNYIQRSERYFLNKCIYNQRVEEEAICVEAIEWTISADTFRAHMEHLL